MRPGRWKERGVSSSVISRRERAGPGTVATGQGPGVAKAAKLGRRVAAWLGGWPPQAAFPYGSKLRRPQGFTTQERAQQEEQGLGRKQDLPRPPTGACVPVSMCPVLSWEADQLQSHSRGCSPHLLLPRTGASSPRLLLVPSLTPHTPATA